MLLRIVSGTLNHVPEANKQTKSAGRADMSPTLRGGQSTVSRGEKTLFYRESRKKIRLVSDSIGYVRIGTPIGYY